MEDKKILSKRKVREVKWEDSMKDVMTKVQYTKLLYSTSYLIYASRYPRPFASMENKMANLNQLVYFNKLIIKANAHLKYTKKKLIK